MEVMLAWTDIWRLLIRARFAKRISSLCYEHLVTLLGGRVMGVTEIMGSATESVYQQNKSWEAATEKSANNTNTVENAMEPSQGDASEL